MNLFYEKVEGFYYTCKKKGLTGKQGVIIPRKNLRNLVLEGIMELILSNHFILL